MSQRSPSPAPAPAPVSRPIRRVASIGEMIDVCNMNGDYDRAQKLLDQAAYTALKQWEAANPTGKLPRKEALATFCISTILIRITTVPKEDIADRIKAIIKKRAAKYKQQRDEEEHARMAEETRLAMVEAAKELKASGLMDIRTEDCLTLLTENGRDPRPDVSTPEKFFGLLDLGEDYSGVAAAAAQASQAAYTRAQQQQQQQQPVFDRAAVERASAQHVIPSPRNIGQLPVVGAVDWSSPEAQQALAVLQSLGAQVVLPQQPQFESPPQQQQAMFGRQHSPASRAESPLSHSSQQFGFAPPLTHFTPPPPQPFPMLDGPPQQLTPLEFPQQPSLFAQQQHSPASAPLPMAPPMPMAPSHHVTGEAEDAANVIKPGIVKKRVSALGGVAQNTGGVRRLKKLPKPAAPPVEAEEDDHFLSRQETPVIEADDDDHFLGRIGTASTATEHFHPQDHQ